MAAVPLPRVLSELGNALVQCLSCTTCHMRAGSAQARQSLRGTKSHRSMAARLAEDSNGDWLSGVYARLESLIRNWQQNLLQQNVRFCWESSLPFQMNDDRKRHSYFDLTPRRRTLA